MPDPHTQFKRSVEWKQTRGPHFVRILYQACRLLQLPLAIWRSPKQTQKQAVVDLAGSLARVDLNVSGMASGFMLAPFATTQPDSSLLIRAGLYLKNDSEVFLNHGLYESDKQETVKIEERLANKISGIRDLPNNNRPTATKAWQAQTPGGKNHVVPRALFCNWVQEAIRQIKNGRMSKVVLSRNFSIRLSVDFDPFELFDKLCLAYPDAFISLVAIPDMGIWIGATPEVLLSLQENELTTVSLAGTRRVSENGNLAALTWSKKDRHEQQIVSDFIKDSLQQQQIYDFEERGPETVRAGDVLHLQTRFRCNLANMPGRAQLVDRTLKALHPTPAVCGAPKTEAMAFIRNHETHDREFYAGFLGPVNLENQTHLFVNLRCMQLRASSAILYAGSGITIDSDPEQEWLETELKLNTLLKFLQGETPATPTDKHLAARKELCEEGL